MFDEIVEKPIRVFTESLFDYFLMLQKLGLTGIGVDKLFLIIYTLG
jgi:hypothetical protein